MKKKTFVARFMAFFRVFVGAGNYYDYWVTSSGYDAEYQHRKGKTVLK